MTGNVEDENFEKEIDLGGVWMVGNIEAENDAVGDLKMDAVGDLKMVVGKKNKKKGKNVQWKRDYGLEKDIFNWNPVKGNQFENLMDDYEDEEQEAKVEIGMVDQAKVRTNQAALEFNVAEVRRPLASAAAVVKVGNRIVLDEMGSYVENKVTGEKMEVKMRNGTFVFEVEYNDGEHGEITLDSGAGASVWPVGERNHVRMLPKKDGLRMIAANGTTIDNYGCNVMQFRGDRVEVNGVDEEILGFSRRM